MVQTTLGIYRRIDELGFEEVSKEKYADWIRNAEKEMRKPEYQQKMQLQQVIK